MPTPAQMPRIWLVIAMIAAYTALEHIRLHVWQSPLLWWAEGVLLVGVIVAAVLTQRKR